MQSLPAGAQDAPPSRGRPSGDARVDPGRAGVCGARVRPDLRREGGDGEVLLRVLCPSDGAAGGGGGAPSGDVWAREWASGDAREVGSSSGNGHRSLRARRSMRVRGGCPGRVHPARAALGDGVSGRWPRPGRAESPPLQSTEGCLSRRQAGTAVMTRPRVEKQCRADGRAARRLPRRPPTASGGRAAIRPIARRHFGARDSRRDRGATGSRDPVHCVDGEAKADGSIGAPRFGCCTWARRRRHRSTRPPRGSMGVSNVS